MSLLDKLIKPVHAHCDLFCGVYDPAQARIEAQAVLNAVRKYNESDDEVFKARALAIKEERAQLVKEHLWVLWTDFFKPVHVEAHPELHDLFWRATKAAGDSKKDMSEETALKMIALVDEVGALFAEVKPGYNYEAIVANLSL